VKIYDSEHQLSLVLLTNHLELPASSVSLLYRKRWQVELFFKWIKQHLKLKAFLGRSSNAVRSQVWAAVCAYLLVMLAKQELRLPQTLHRILQTLSITPFEQVPLAELLAENECFDFETYSPKQLGFNLV
jgi:IS4 transposase